MKKLISIFAVMFLLSFGGTLLANPVQLIELSVSPGANIKVNIPGIPYVGLAEAGVYNLGIDLDGDDESDLTLSGYCVDPAFSNTTAFTAYNFIAIPDQTNYLQAAWIFSTYGTPATDATLAVDIQTAIWTVVGGGVDFTFPDGLSANALAYVAAAKAAVEAGWDATGGLSLAVSPNDTDYYGVEFQDYIVKTPEPASLLLLGLGLFGVGLVGRKKQS